MERLRGGSTKGVYRLTFDDESTAVLYVWDAAENYWPPRAGGAGQDRTDPFADASGPDFFEASQARLSIVGVRTPRTYLVDRSRSRYPADIALDEDVRGGTLEALIQRDPRAAEPTLARLAAALGVMHQHRGRHIGRLAVVDGGGAQLNRTCEQVVLDRALDDLAQAAPRVGRIADVQERLADTARELAAAVLPRAEYVLIHGELGPDHVLVDESGDPVMIDIEGAMFFDVEWEHVFLELRFQEQYRWLSASDLDDRRMRFYRLAMCLSLVAGPLRLLDGDFPDRTFMMGIVEHNTQRALAFVR